MTEVEDKLCLARATVLKKAPYFSSDLYGFIYAPEPSIGTMAITPGLLCLYNPTWVMVATVDQLAADLAHEISHVQRRHHSRFKAMPDPRLRNIACDLPINQNLRDSGWKLCDQGPYCAVFPEHYGLPLGLTAEAYYALLSKMLPEELSKGSSGVGSGDCGSFVGTGLSSTLEEQLHKEHGGRSEVEVTLVQKRSDAQIREAAKGQGRGSLPAYLTEYLPPGDDIVSSVSWEEELSAVVLDGTEAIRAGGTDFTYALPSALSFYSDTPRPGRCHREPSVAVVIDTSASMYHRQLKRAAAETGAILEDLEIEEVWFCQADACIAMEWKKVTPEFLRDMPIKGRGGTDFRPAIAGALQLDPRPDLLLYMTDGDGALDPCPPEGLAVAWVLIGTSTRLPWGHSILIPA